MIVLRWGFFILCLPVYLVGLVCYAIGLGVFMALERAGNYLFDR